MSYLPLIEKLRAALANLPPPPKMQPSVCRQAPKAPTPETNAVDARDDDAETRAEKDPIEIDMDSDEDDDVMLREILAKKMAPNPMSAVKNLTEKPPTGDDRMWLGTTPMTNAKKRRRKTTVRVSCRKKKKT